MTASGKERVSRYWTRWAPDYEAHQARRSAAQAERQAWKGVWAPALPAPPASVLDLGTGSGHAAFTLADMGYQVTGVDAAEGMIEQARRKVRSDVPGAGPNPAFVHSDASDPQWTPGSFDALTARYFLWTLPSPLRSLSRWLRLLRPGGRLVVVDSIWFPRGLSSEISAVGSAPSRSRDFARAYSGQSALFPLAEASSIQDFADSITRAGFTDVTVDSLPEILERDARHGVAPGHRPQLQYRVSARRPAGVTP